MNAISMTLCGLIGLALLYCGAEFLVRGGSAIASRSCVSPLVIGRTLVAFSTSAPEFFISTGAALHGLGEACIGNVVGSNVFNILGILGVSALLRPVFIEGMDWADFGMMIATAVLLGALFSMRRRLGRMEGAILLAVYGGYLAWLVRTM